MTGTKVIRQVIFAGITRSDSKEQAIPCVDPQIHTLFNIVKVLTLTYVSYLWRIDNSVS